MTHATALDSQTARPLPSVRVLLQSVVDYAGLFPPASLSMSAAVTEYATQRDGDQAWLLGRFVLPAARLEEFENDGAALLPREASRSWALAALLSGEVEEDVRRVEEFNGRHRDARTGAVFIDTLELKTHGEHEIQHAAELLDRQFDAYMEIPIADDPTPLVAAIAGVHAKAKVRMGGTTPELFPVAAHVVRFARACVDHRVAFKATAGLHHPWRDEYPLTYAADAPRCTMFGFTNLLLAVAALQTGASDREAARILEERDTRAFAFQPDRVSWREHVFSIDALRRARETMTAFGSCSFRDPVTDLRVTGLL